MIYIKTQKQIKINGVTYTEKNIGSLLATLDVNNGGNYYLDDNQDIVEHRDCYMVNLAKKLKNGNTVKKCIKINKIIK